MIIGYADHAANERTFLAWVRTGIAVIGFGFVIEKFNLFLTTIAGSGFAESARALAADGSPSLIVRYDGLALIYGGIALIILTTLRFIRTTRLLDDLAQHEAGCIRAELIASAGLVLLIAGYSLFLTFV